MYECKRCDTKYDISHIPKKYIDKDIDKYKLLCSNCRKFRLCESCGIEFHHHQNQTCSKECAKSLKEKSFILSCGTKHNFSKESKSRLEWEGNMLKCEGIVNVFQRSSTKEKIQKTITEKYGVSHISKSELIKSKKKETLKNTIKSNPNLFIDNWHILHRKFISELGYDPRLHIFGKSSKESLNVFLPLIDWCLENGILDSDIYIGHGGKKEYFISHDRNIFFYDFVIRSKFIIIEFNGVSFHAKPEYIHTNEWFSPFTKESARDNINRSEIKHNAAKSNKFEIMEIWSDEDSLINLEKCKNFIKERI